MKMFGGICAAILTTVASAQTIPEWGTAQALASMCVRARDNLGPSVAQSEPRFVAAWTCYTIVEAWVDGYRGGAMHGMSTVFARDEKSFGTTQGIADVI